MQIGTGMKILGVAALGVGAGLALAACAGGTKKPKAEGPMADFTVNLMSQLREGNGTRSLSVTADAVRQVVGDDGRQRGAFDGTRLLQAADAHAYGTPTIVDAALDKAGDGTATFNEVRHVVRHFDADASGVFDQSETLAFEAAVGIRWLPA